MNWKKMGNIYCPDEKHPVVKSHAALPVADLLNEKRARIYFAGRDEKGRSTPTFIDVEANKPSNVLYQHDKPIMDLGARGTFDDNGIMPSCIVNSSGKKWLYYIGWNPQVTVSYRLSIGLAVSEDGGVTFKRVSQGPVRDRSIHEPFFNTAPWVLKEGDKWHMWYVSCTGWKMIHDWPEPLYLIRHVTSPDGKEWHRPGTICIDYDDFTEAIGKPYVYREGNRYKMIYSYRNSVDYRKDPAKSYRLGYAESDDGVHWQRMDDKMNLKFSADGWDSVMMEYTTGYTLNGKHYLFYNGNGFGASGIGYAVADFAGE